MATELAAGSQTLDRALRALIRIGESGARGLTLAECTSELGYTKPTTHRILHTFARRGFLRVDPQRGLYTLGVEEVRRRGYSIDDVENEDGIRCVGAPIFDHAGLVCAGISVSGPAMRLTPDRFPELGELVRRTAFEISRQIGYDP